MPTHPGSFPTDTLIAFVFACAIVGATAFITHLAGKEWSQWWSARNWPEVSCTILRLEPDLRYRYEFNGVPYESGSIGIGDNRTFEVQSALDVGSTLRCHVNPAAPTVSLLSREFSGWWFVPAAWLFSAFMLATTVPGFISDMWQWATFRPGTPLTWAQWLQTFYRGNGWMYAAAGLACLVPGVLLLKFMTIDPWWGWWQAQSWPQSTCTIVRSEARDTTMGFTGSRGFVSGYILNISFTHTVDGRPFTSHDYSPWKMGETEWLLQATKDKPFEELMAKLAVGTKHSCFYSPEDPSRAYIFRDTTPETNFHSLAFSLTLTLLGLVILAARH